MTSDQTVYNWEAGAESGQWILNVREEGKDTEHVVLTHKKYVIGRSQDSDIRIINSQSSRRHAVLVYKDSNWYIKDLKSKNGVTIDKKQVPVAKLTDGSSFIIVDSKLTLKYRSDSQTVKKQKKILSLSDNKGKMIVGGSVIALLLMLVVFLFRISSEPTEPVQKTVIENPESDLSKQLPPAVLSDETKERPSQPTVTVNKERAKDLYRQGLLFYDNGNLVVAIDYWDEALLYDRENRLVLQKLARATKELEHQVSKHFKLAQNHMKYQRLFEAEREYTIVLGLIRNKSDARYLKASTQLTTLQKR